MDDVFSDRDLAIATYRHAVSEIIPELTRVAWRSRSEDIARLTPGVRANAFIYRYTRKQYEREFGAKYRKPGLIARLISLVYRIVPKFGPLRPLRFKTPSRQAERLFSQSFQDTRARYAAALNAIGAGRFDLVNTNFDTGKPSAQGEYALADRTYFELLENLAHRRFADLPPALRTNITAYYARGVRTGTSRGDRKRAEKIQRWLADMNNDSRRNPR